MAADHRFEDLAIRALVDISEIELPPLLVESEIDNMLAGQAEAMRRQQVSMEDYLNTVGKSVEELQEEARPQAEERLLRSLALQAFREKEGLEVTSEDIEEELGKVVLWIRCPARTPSGAYWTRRKAADTLRICSSTGRRWSVL